MRLKQRWSHIENMGLAAYLKMLYRNYRYAYVLAKYEKQCPHPVDMRTTNTAFGEPWACTQCGYVKGVN